MIIGTVLADRYRIDSLLGRGGMGSVWLATDTRDHHVVVVKLISRAISGFPIAVTRFLREMRVLALAQSPHVVELLDRGVDAELGPYLVMERLEGEDLEARVGRTGPVPLREMAPIAEQIGSALETIHGLGFVHRDVKPSNIYLCPQVDGSMVAKLLDFGAVMADVPLQADGSRTTPGMLIGTITRMSPEQIQGNPTNERTDIWSFALMVYEAVVGKPAIRPDWSMGEIVVRICGGDIAPPSRMNPDLPAAFDAWFKRSTKLNPVERFESIREQVEALVSICGELVLNYSETRRIAESEASQPQRIEVSGSIPAFPLLTLRGSSKAANEVLRSGSRGTLRPMGVPGRRSSWPAPAGFVPRAAVGCPTLRPPSRWPSAR